MATDDELLKALGRVVLCAAGVEYAAYDLAISLGVGDAPKVSVSQALKRARRRFADDPPPWATLTLDELDAWIRKATDALDARNDVFHAIQLHRGAEGDQWVPAHYHLRDGVEVDTTPPALQALGDQLNEARRAVPTTKVLPVVQPGINRRILQAPGYEAAIRVEFNEEDQAWPEFDRAEVEAWRPDLTPSELAEWTAWLGRLIDPPNPSAVPSRDDAH